LETVAAFGLERLEEAGETDATRRRHAAFFARLAEDTALRLRGHDQHRALAELEAEPANLRAALDDAAARGWSLLCLRLATSLAWYRLVWGRFREAGRDLRTALDTVAACDDDRAPDTLRRHAETWLTAVAPHGSDPAAARRQVLERYGNARDTDAAGRAFAQWLFAFTMLHSGDATEAAQLVGAALATFRDVGDRWGVAAALSTRADLALVQGDLVRAQHDSEASRSLFTQLGDRRGHVHPTGVLGAVAEIRGDYATAAARYREALRIAEELKLWASVSKQLACLGRLALLAGDHADAVAYHERALRVAEEQSNRPAAAFAGTGLAMIARRSGDLDAAEARMRDLLDWNHHTGYQPGAAFALAELGFVAEQRGDAATAERRHRASLEAARATGDDRAVALAIEGLAGSAGLTGGHRRAARLLGVAAALRETAGAPLPSDEGHDVHRIATRTRGALGDADFVAELRRGGRLDLADPAVLGDGQRDVSAP
jgi:tetratricopeptide (TPR) repeat protein